MAGAAAAGPANARADLFDTRLWFLVTHRAEADAIRTARSFVTALGARAWLLEDDGSEHDRMMAAVSHLPQMVAAALMVVAADAAGERLTWAGSGLRDTTRLADSDAAMWQSIADTNAANLRPLLLEMAARLRRLADQLGDGTSVSELLDAANRKRALL
jgi:prephenate dehydrogenase